MTIQDKNPRICIVTAGGPFAAIIANAIGERFGAVDIILEQPESRVAFLKRRAWICGWMSTAGQFATMLWIGLGKRVLAKRIDRFAAETGIRTELDADHRVLSVESVNSGAFLKALEGLAPRVVLLTGCRIVKPDRLRAIPATVLNYHAGITPAYRGMNGGYWALASGDEDNFGATVHLVDDGVDTGMIVGQVRGKPAPGDSIMTYAYTLAALSRDMCVAAVGDALAGSLTPRSPQGPSKQWFHPPIWTYLWNGLSKRVW